jgi:hypothetical protein
LDLHFAKRALAQLTVHRFRIGVLTSGGDCPGLNAVIRAAVASAHTLGWEVLGFIDGYEGLLSPVNYKILTLENTQGIMPVGAADHRRGQEDAQRPGCARADLHWRRRLAHHGRPAF